MGDDEIVRKISWLLRAIYFFLSTTQFQYSLEGVHKMARNVDRNIPARENYGYR